MTEILFGSGAGDNVIIGNADKKPDQGLRDGSAPILFVNRTFAPEGDMFFLKEGPNI